MTMTIAEGYAWGLAAREHDEAALADLGVYRHTAEVPEGVLEAVVVDIDAADVPDGILEAIAHLPEDVAEAVVDGWYGIRRTDYEAGRPVPVTITRTR